MASLRLSCLVHGVLVLLAVGCAVHRPLTAIILEAPEIATARAFVMGVSDKMPLWDADAVSRYERVEIATVKADIAMARQEEGTSRFLEDVSRLHLDWNALIALDEMLKKEWLI